MIVGNVYQRAHPQLHLAEDARESPHVLILQIAAVAPAIHLDSQFVLALAQVFRHIKLCRRHGVLAVAHLLSVHPHVERGMHAAEVQDEVLGEHLLRHLNERHVGAYRIAVLVGRPVAWRFAGHAGTVALEGIADVRVDGRTETLQLPVAWHGDLVPPAHVVVLPIEVSRPLLGLSAPVEQPLSVKRQDLLTLLPF